MISLEGPNKTIPTLSSSRFKTIPSSPESNCTSSPYCTFDKPYTRAIPSPTCNTVPTSSSDADASRPVNCCFNIADTSAGLISAIIYVVNKFVFLLNSCLILFNLFLKLALYSMSPTLKTNPPISVLSILFTMLVFLLVNLETVDKT